jgi:hypothetical protein
MANLAPHVAQFYSIAWSMDETGMIGQTLEDIQDSSIRLFTESAKSHNQALHDQ